jgi:peptidoglycan hydrolase-like protein with peptidoglycan-binding domain
VKRSRQLLGLLGAVLLAIPAGTVLTASAAPLPLESKKQSHSTSSPTSASSSSQHFAAARSNFLPSKKSTKHRRSRQKGQMAPTRDRIGEIQESLGRAGYYPGEPNGKWDASTVDAMKRFQQAKGLSPTGKIDALTLQKLGLGSDIAGVGAPQPAPPTAPPPGQSNP